MFGTEEMALAATSTSSFLMEASLLSGITKVRSDAISSLAHKWVQLNALSLVRMLNLATTHQTGLDAIPTSLKTMAWNGTTCARTKRVIKTICGRTSRPLWWTKRHCWEKITPLARKTCRATIIGCQPSTEANKKWRPWIKKPKLKSLLETPNVTPLWASTYKARPLLINIPHLKGSSIKGRNVNFTTSTRHPSQKLTCQKTLTSKKWPGSNIMAV